MPNKKQTFCPIVAEFCTDHKGEARAGLGEKKCGQFFKKLLKTDRTFLLKINGLIPIDIDSTLVNC
ncbi:hypothetical protein DB278_07610 [Pasteurella multocida]|nr:hypothetical protein DB278_07610 [Pasteurella multocida]